MPITAPNRPELIVSGLVVAVAPVNKWDDATKRRTDEVERFDVTIQQGTAQLAVRYPYPGPDAAPVPAQMTRVAIVAKLSESRDYGASLRFDRDLTADDLDQLVSASGALSAK